MMLERNTIYNMDCRELLAQLDEANDLSVFPLFAWGER